MKTPIQMALMGCGGMSGAHARRFKTNPDVQIVALCDVKSEIVEAFIERNLQDYELRPAIYTDFETLLREQKPDAVTIVTPHTLHFEHGMLALQHGCHVLMEKPMVTNSDDAIALRAAAEKAGKTLVIGYNTPCAPAFRWLRDTIRSQKYGKLETVTGWQTQGWAKSAKGTWRQNPALSGGGQMYDSGAHMFNSLVWSVESPVETVFAFVDNLDTPVDINGVVSIRFQNGVLATMTIAGNCPPSRGILVFTFPQARIEIDGWGGQWVKVFNDGKDANHEEPIELEGTYQSPNDNFVDVLMGRAEPLTSPTNGVIQSQLMDAIYQSAATGSPAQPKN